MSKLRLSPTSYTSGEKYIMEAPDVSGNKIPINGSVEVYLFGLFVEATGEDGVETFEVRLVDENVFSTDSVLHVLTATVPRPEGCIVGALIGPGEYTEAVTLKNDPDGVVSGRDGTSGESEAEIAYEIGSSDNNSPVVIVTADSQ